jgi:hypothetical protein
MTVANTRPKINYDGELDSFVTEPETGDVLAWISDSENYAHPVRIRHAELAGMAEASAEAFRTRPVTCGCCHLDRPAFEINDFGICVVCFTLR